MLFCHLSSPPAHDTDNHSNCKATAPESERNSISKPHEICRNPHEHTMPKANDNHAYCGNQNRHKGERFTRLASPFILLKAKGNIPNADIGDKGSDYHAHCLDKQQIWSKFGREYIFHFSPFQILNYSCASFLNETLDYYIIPHIASIVNRAQHKICARIPALTHIPSRIV